MMKRMLLIFFIVLMASSNAHAVQWTLDAYFDGYGPVHFSIKFDDANNDNILSLSEITWFSGAIFITTLYDQMENIPNDVTLPTLEGGTVTLVDPTNYMYSEYWWFKSTEGPIRNGAHYSFWEYTVGQSPVPIPAAVWLLGSGLVGLFGLRRKMNA